MVTSKRPPRHHTSLDTRKKVGLLVVFVSVLGHDGVDIVLEKEGTAPGQRDGPLLGAFLEFRLRRQVIPPSMTKRTHHDITLGTAGVP